MKEQICVSKGPFQRCGGRLARQRPEVGNREFSLQAKRVSTAQQREYQWQQTRGTGINVEESDSRSLAPNSGRKTFTQVASLTVHLERGFPWTGDRAEMADLGERIGRSVWGL